MKNNIFIVIKVTGESFRLTSNKLVIPIKVGDAISEGDIIVAKDGSVCKTTTAGLHVTTHVIPFRAPCGIAGVTVELLTDEGTVSATTATNRDGQYRFSDFHETGDYQVRIANSSRLQLTSDDTLDTLISRGNERVRGLNFGVSLLDQLAKDRVTSKDRNRRTRQAANVDALFGSEAPLA